MANHNNSNQVRLAVRGWLPVLVVLAVTASTILVPARARAAACQLPTTDYGSVSLSLTVPATATYRLWSRMMAPDTTNNTYLLEVDGATCYKVGSGLTAGEWTWVDYQDGTSASKIEQSLAQGSHSLKLIGNAPGVKVDLIEAISNLSCTPLDLGTNCNVPDDTVAPTVSLTAPSDGAQLSGTVTITATASDNVGVSKTEFYDNSTLISTATVAPYSTTWDTTKQTSGAHTLTARAYDTSGNVGTSSVTVYVQNGDQQAPSTPSGLTATAVSSSQINLSWTASTDNVAVSGYDVYRGSTRIATVTTTSFGDSGLAANTTYAYSVQARDAAGNVSQPSTTATATTQPTQSVAVLSGKVTKSSGSPLSGAKVAVLLSTKNKLTTRTLTDGSYSLTFTTGGTYSVTYSKTGYYPKTVSVVVVNGQVVTQNVTLVKK